MYWAAQNLYFLHLTGESCTNEFAQALDPQIVMDKILMCWRARVTHKSLLFSFMELKYSSQTSSSAGVGIWKLFSCLKSSHKSFLAEVSSDSLNFLG